MRISRATRGLPQRWVQLASKNAENELRMRRASQATLAEQFAELGVFLGLAAPPGRIECFDVSHTMGEATIASCVVFGPTDR